MKALDRYYLLDLERTINMHMPFFWKANKRGYTSNLETAGLYSFEMASEIVSSDFDNRTVMVNKNVIEKIIKEF